MNPLRTDAVAEALEEDGATALGLPGAMRVDRVGALVRAGAFDRGDLVASDYYAQLIAQSPPVRGHAWRSVRGVAPRPS